MSIEEISGPEKTWVSKEELIKKNRCLLHELNVEKRHGKSRGISYFLMGICAGALLIGAGVLYSRTNKSESPVKFLDVDKNGFICSTEKNLFYKNMDQFIGNNPDKKLFYKRMNQFINDYNFR